MRKQLSGKGILAVCVFSGIASLALHMMEGQIGLATIMSLVAADPSVWRSAEPQAGMIERFITTGGPLRSLILGGMWVQLTLQALFPTIFTLWLLDNLLPKLGRSSRIDYLLGGLACGACAVIAALYLGWIVKWPSAIFAIGVFGLGAPLYRVIAGDTPPEPMPVERVRAVRLRDTRM